MIKKNKLINDSWKLDNSYARLPEIFFSKITPNSVSSPKLVILNHDLARKLGLDIAELQGIDGVNILSGNKIPNGSLPIAQAYAGHQFGYFTMLGDGRALLLGEQITPLGQRYDIQLKGAGRTPYSRGGDGKAAIQPMLREYIISEGMNGLGIPTTRSLAVILTGEQIIRETQLKGGVLTRIASSHIRVGTFEYAAKWGTNNELKSLADYTIERHFSYIKDEKNPYILLLQEVIKRQAYLIAKWQLVGFIHGVMNTDNMTISGETIDYGPCAFMDTYSPSTVFSSIDVHGRYAYENQPKIAAWNLARFAETLLPLLHKDQNKAVDLAQELISEFSSLYYDEWIKGMRCKLGMFNEELEDKDIIEELLNMMEKNKADYTNTFRGLTLDCLEDMDLFKTEEFSKWKAKWQDRLKRQGESKEQAYSLMKNSNPSIIPRNHRVEEALGAAEKGDYEVMKKLLKVLLQPYEYSYEQEAYSVLSKNTNNNYQTFCGT